MPRSVYLSISLPYEYYKKVVELSKERKLSVSRVIRDIVKEYFGGVD